MTDLRKRYAELKAELDAIYIKYPPGSLDENDNTPEEILAYCRKIINFQSNFSVSQQDMHSLYWKI